MLHKTNRMRGFHIHATDGGIGHVDDFLVDEGTWHVRYFVVDTSNWIGGRWVLISPTVVTRIDSFGSKMYVSLTREDIKRSPSIDSADIAIAETLPTVWIM
jgi:hypothetical protein